MSSFEAPDSTDVKWSPDGQHILTTTCAPRLRMSNGFKVWHYTSTLMYETFYKDATSLGPGEELWEAIWRPNLDLGMKKFQILDRPITGKDVFLNVILISGNLMIFEVINHGFLCFGYLMLKNLV